MNYGSLDSEEVAKAKLEGALQEDGEFPTPENAHAVGYQAMEYVASWSQKRLGVLVPQSLPPATEALLKGRILAFNTRPDGKVVGYVCQKNAQILWFVGNGNGPASHSGDGGKAQ